MPSDVADKAKASADATLGADKKQTPTYTQEQLDKAKRDAASAVLADAGRLKAEAEKALKAATDAENRLAQIEKERQEAELEAARDEPDKLARIRLAQELRQRDAKLAKAQDELNEANTKLNEFSIKDKEANRQKVVSEVAARLGVNATTLTKLAKFTEGTVEAIEEIAKDLHATPPLNPDNNRSSGGTPQDINAVRVDYVAGKINAVQYAEKCKSLGIQP